jgi:hypothetical protein
VEKIIAMDVSLPWAEYPSLPMSEDPKAKSAQGVFFSNLIGRLKQIPGVRSVGAASALPMTGGLPDGMFLLMTQNEAPKTMDGLAALWNQKERMAMRIFVSRPTDISRC